MKQPAFRYLCTLANKGQKKSLFILPSAGTTPMSLMALARTIDASYSVHSFSYAGIETSDEPHSSVEDMAAAYVEELLKMQPEGAYQLAGVCFGGVVAYEMVRQLEAKGRRVDTLVVLDTFKPQAKSDSWSKDEYKQAESTMIKIYKDAFRRSGSLSPQAKKRLIAVFMTHLEAGYKYIAEPIRANIRLLRSPVHDDLMYRGWEMMSHGTYETIAIMDEPFALLASGDVRSLGLKISAVLECAESAGETVARELRCMAEFDAAKEIMDILGYDGRFAATITNIPRMQEVLSVSEEDFTGAWLSDEEMVRYQGYKSEKRRTEWLAGRIAAKRALLALSASHDESPSDLLIVNGTENSPQVRTRGDEGPLYVTISHDGEIGFAVASDEGGIGADVQSISDDILPVADSFSSELEVDILTPLCSGLSRNGILTALWAMKEASFKASVDLSRSDAPVELKRARKDGKFILCDLEQAAIGPIAAVSYVQDGYCFSVAYYRKRISSERPTSGAGDLEQKLGRIWQEQLKVAAIKATDNYFDLGGTSLEAVIMFQRIKDELGVEVSVSDLFAAPTIAGMALLMSRDRRAGKSSSVVPMREDSGDRTPLFLVHGLDGEVMVFHKLVQHLKMDRKVYGLRLFADGFEEDGSISIENLAERYVADILSIQNDGNYCIAGYSIGSQIAFEVARKLKKRGRTVTFLGVLDGAPVNSVRSFSAAIPWMMNVPAGILDFLRCDEKLLRLKKRVQSIFSRREPGKNDLDDMIKHLLRTEIDIEYPDHAIAVFRKLILSQWEYHPDAYDGDMVLFKARKQPLSEFSDKYKGWSRMVSGSVDLRVVPGDHVTMMTNPYVAELADAFDDCLERL